MTRCLAHPHIPDTCVSVAAADVGRWLAVGWLDERPSDHTHPDPEPYAEDLERIEA